MFIVIEALRREIAERKKLEQVLLESQERLLVMREESVGDFFDHSPFGLLWVGSDWLIGRANNAALQLLGCEGRDCLGHKVQEFFADPEEAASALRRLTRGEPMHNLRVRVRRQDGTTRQAEIDAHGIWKRGRIVNSRWFLRDLTRRVELEREIVVAAEEERQRIGRDLHDDLCQQLTGIEFLSQALARQLALRSARDAGRAREIADRVRDAITRTRDLARGLSPWELEERGLRGALEDLAGRTRELFKIDCRFRCENPRMRADPVLGVHLYRIAQEAVSNAVRHGRARRIDLELERKGGRLALVVRDFGIGMPKRLRECIGTGVRGMKYRAGLIGASLWLEPNPHGGTVVVCEAGDPSPESGELKDLT